MIPLSSRVGPLRVKAYRWIRKPTRELQKVGRRFLIVKRISNDCIFFPYFIRDGRISLFFSKFSSRRHDWYFMSVTGIIILAIKWELRTIALA